MKNLKVSKQAIFITVSIAFLTFMVCFYGYRLIHFYRLEHPEVNLGENEKLVLSEKVISQKMLGNTGSGLYEENGTYYFKGTPTNNYVNYSGRLWRIVSINKEKEVKLISEEVQTLLSYGNEVTFENAYPSIWLNESEETNSGIFYKTLTNPTSYLTKTSTCIDESNEVGKSSCKKTVDDFYVGLLSMEEYKKAGANQSYLNTNTYYWLANTNSSHHAWYVFDKGGMNQESDMTHHSYGVRPTITLKSDTLLLSGDGSKEAPYVFEETSGDTIQAKQVGEYIHYSNLSWRIIGKEEGKIKVALDGTVMVKEDPYQSIFSTVDHYYSTTQKKNVGYYLNNTFYQSLENRDYIVKSKWNIGVFDSIDTYDYRTIYNKTIEANVGMMQLSDFYLNEYGGIFTLTGGKDTDETIYTISEDQKWYASTIDQKHKLRPVIYLDATLKTVEGNGTKGSPYVIGR